MSYIDFDHITKEYNSGGSSIFALKDASFSVEKGELAVILGASGAGKTTALNILGGMDTATSGKVLVDGADVTAFGKRQLTQYRRTDIGFVFQFYNLVPNLTALENVELASQICEDSLDAAQTLEKVGLGMRMKNFPAQLSGGEQQRVSIARAWQKIRNFCCAMNRQEHWITTPESRFFSFYRIPAERKKITVLIITHNSALAPMADRLIQFKSGTVISETRNEHPVSISEIEW